MKLSTVLLCLIINFNALIGFNYDLIVIGAGAAGSKAATMAHDNGKKVAIIEKNKLGGGRLWHGDIPYKSLYALSKWMHLPFDIGPLESIQEKSAHMQGEKLFQKVSDIRNNVYKLMLEQQFSDRKIDIFYGNPQFIDNHTISLDDQLLTASKFLIATGSRSHVPDIKGITTIPYLTRENFFDLKKLPSSIIIVGGGALGVELASALNRLGVRVSLVMKHAVLLPTFDYEMVEMITDKLMEEGVDIQCDMCPIEVVKKGDLIEIIALNRADKKCSFKAESLFLATGSIPNIENLSLEKAGVKLNKKTHTLNKPAEIAMKNAIITNHTMQTSAHNIYASGDVTGLHILSRVAIYQAKTAIKNMFSPEKTTLAANYSNMAKTISGPCEEFATVGLTEQDVFKRFGHNSLTYRYQYKLLEQAHIENRKTGLAKFICDKNGILLGAHIFGANAGEIIDALQIGENLSKYSEEEYLKITTSPSYRDMLYEVSHQCAKDIKNNTVEKPSLLQVLVARLLGKKNK